MDFGRQSDVMRIRIWNAFASNNSGSYTIVGRFDSDESAAKVGVELLALVKAQSAWAGGNQAKPSPLTVFAKENGLSSHQEPGADQNWPEYSQQEHPDVWTLGSQVFMYSDYQISMTRLFGELIYARGGRVEYEVDHAHCPMAALFEIYWPPNKTDREKAESVLRLIRKLQGDPRFYRNQGDSAPYHAWLTGEKFPDPDLRIGCVFENLVTGFAAVDEAVKSEGAYVNVRLFESFSENGNEFSFLRPSQPPIET
jgi:hypothetical protein